MSAVSPMDPLTKKDKSDENGAATTSSAGRAATLGLTCDDVLRLLKPLSRDMLAHITAHGLDAVCAAAAADRDPALRIFLHWRCRSWGSSRFKSLSSIISSDNSLVLLSGFTLTQNCRYYCSAVLIYLLDIAHTYLLDQTLTLPPCQSISKALFLVAYSASVRFLFVFELICFSGSSTHRSQTLLQQT